MSTPQQPAKPIFKAPEQKPFKAAEPPSPPIGQEKAEAEPPKTAPRTNGWAPIDTAPEEADARFMVRASVNGKPIPSTETLVRYRPSRKMVAGKWKPGLTIIDDRLGTKLGFRPTEWAPVQEKKKANG